MTGYVYVLSNPSMPGVVKIGFSNAGGKARSKQLYTTSVPNAFKLEFEVLVDRPERLERSVHNELKASRVTDNREFFKLSVAEAIATILGIAHRRYKKIADDQIEPEILVNERPMTAEQIAANRARGIAVLNELEALLK